MARPVLTPVGELEQFLVQDVILTLGNLRGSLAWIAGDGDSGLSPGYRAGLERLDRQIELLEDRARTFCETPRPFGPTPPAPSAAAYAEGSGLTLEAILRDALGDTPGDGGDPAGPGEDAFAGRSGKPSSLPTLPEPDPATLIFRSGRRPIADATPKPGADSDG